MLNYLDLLNHKGIWNIKQNKPTLIADDLKLFGIPKKITYAILLGKGVFKWLSVRRDIIKLKNIWKCELTELYIKAQKNKGTPEYQYIVGYIKALEKCRKEVRDLCHSDRFQAPDFDKGANKFLQDLE